MRTVVTTFLSLLASTAGASQLRGTVQSVTPTTVNIIVGVGEALRIERVLVKSKKVRGAIKPGDVVEVTPESVTKCSTDENGLVKDCNGTQE